MILREIANNWQSGITVALVSVPLSISLALAAGGTPVMGITTAVWAGIATAIFGGSQFNINGPAGALSGILSVYAVSYGPEVLPILAVLAGIIILGLMLFRLDIYVMFIPSAVMEGFSFAVAIIIGANQLRMGFGLPASVPVRPEFIFNFWETLKHLGELDILSTGTFLVGFGLLWFLVSKWSKIPWGVVLALIAIAIGYAAANGHMVMYKDVKTLQTRYGELNPEVFNFRIPGFPAPKNAQQTQNEVYWDILYGAFSVAFVSTLSHLINARVAERMTNIKFAQAREVFSAFVANFLCGIFGGLPSTAALARTTLNIKTGATSRASGIISAVFVCIISLVVLNWFKYLLLPIVAAILMVTAVRMVELQRLMHMWRFDRKMFWVTIFTTVICVVRDPTDGIIAGGIVSLFIYAKANSKAYGEVSSAIAKEKRITATRSARSIDEEAAAKERERVKSSYKRIGSIVTAGLVGGPEVDGPKADDDVDEEVDLESAHFTGDTLIYKFPSEMTYLNSPAHIERAKQLHQNFQYVILDMRSLYYVDVDGLNALTEIVEEFDRFDKLTLVSAVRPDMEAQLDFSKWYSTKKDKGLVLASDTACLHYIHDYEKKLATQDGDVALDSDSDDEVVSTPASAVAAPAVKAVDDHITSSPTFVVTNLSKTLAKGKAKEIDDPRYQPPPPVSSAPSSSSTAPVVSSPKPSAVPKQAEVEVEKPTEQPKAERLAESPKPSPNKEGAALVEKAAPIVEASPARAEPVAEPPTPVEPVAEETPSVSIVREAPSSPEVVEAAPLREPEPELEPEPVPEPVVPLEDDDEDLDDFTPAGVVSLKQASPVIVDAPAETPVALDDDEEII